MSKGRRIARAAAITLLVMGVMLALGLVWLLFVPTSVERFETTRAKWQPSEAWLLDRHGRILDRQRLHYEFRRFEWMALDEVSPALLSAIVDGEDHRFWEHAGVDWHAIAGALRDQSTSQRRRGASTITMQLARLMQPELRAGHSPGALRRKLAQIRVARTLESRWTKREILEAYLNLVGFRGELQGVDVAARLLAGKSPSGLSLSESMVLAALLPQPAASAERVAARACARASARRITIRCDEIQASASSLLASFDRRGDDGNSDDHLAPHLARTILRKPGERVRTTLDAGIQRLANSVIQQHLAALTARNVRDGAVLIVENDSGHVLAYVGSAGAASRSREVDGVRARRQAGSTLKPFLYELAVERGYVTAASLLDDSPIALDTASGIYLPQNYDRDFKGLVSVRTALGNSLNVPAVRTLVLTGVEPFRDRLRALGYEGITQPGDFYGYALALGSPEVSLWEQVQAYRALARGGRWAPISTRPADARGKDTAVLSTEASFIVSDMMSDRAARSLTFGLDNHLNTPFWSAVKTGTSKDMRDNWCIGFSRDFTVGVWVGNFEGDSMHDVTGVTGAAPVWNELMTALHASRESQPPAAPPGVISARARFTPTVEPARLDYFVEAGQDREVAAISPAGGIAHIASPANGMVIALDPDIPPAFQRVPISVRGVGAEMILKLNGAVIGKAGTSILWAPTPGTHLLALEDARGHTLDRAHFTVR